ncbi:ABC transporter permease [Catenulispora pinisilvae]|uniref:ABC transporter permease n=1 Tax=Catenulispora pinisilvae TaxID=2705253 RepID=UPI00189177C7|nr:ABC transporter permease [Catenulispora pinisilvae]
MTSADLYPFSQAPLTRLLLGRRAFGSMGGGKAGVLIERNVMVYRRVWVAMVSGFFEPVFYLLSIGVGLGKLTGAVDGVPYAHYVAPGLLAVSAMNGAVFDATFNVFFKIKYAKIYDAMLATPLRVGDIALGDIMWAQLRGLMYSAAFLVIMLAMGLVHSWWALLALPVTVLIGFAFGAVGMAATSFMRSWQDFDMITLALMPMFLFSGAFYPLSVYNPQIRVLIEALPLYHGIDLLRALTLGRVHIGLLWDVLYLAVMALIGAAVAARRLEKLLLT